MKSENEARPFLGYSDDPAGSGEAGAITHTPAVPAEKAISSRRRLARDLVVFLIASLLWLGAILIFSSSSSSSSSAMSWPGSATTTTTTTAATSAAASSPKHGAIDYRLHNVTSNARFVTCGNSTAEARGNGCRYDPLLNHWVPVQCFDREWIDEYQDDGSWTGFADVNLTQPLSLEELGTKDHYYTSIRDHVNHCAMLWRKQFWTLFEARKVFDAVIVNTYHTEHCAQFLSDLMTMKRTEPTLVRVGFSGCWIEGEDEL